MTEKKYRIAKDTMGEMQVPLSALYGASTQRAVLNFPISDCRFDSQFIKAMGLIKLYGAAVNSELGLLDGQLAGFIGEAAEEVAAGQWDAEFVVDIFQTGSGTSTNMNANEVLASRAMQIARERGSEVKIHPNDHVNFGQSSNDTIPTAMHVALTASLQERLLPALSQLEAGLRSKSDQFWGVIKTGRSHLQDATPIRLGQEFLGYAGQVEQSLEYLRSALDGLSQLALGGTAIGTGIGTHELFASKVIAKLSERTGYQFAESTNHFRSQSTIDAVVQTSATLKTVAVSLLKLANDLRWLASGPRAGLGEIQLPAVQPGSSIMPGKINPVILESVTMVCAQVIGNDGAVTIAGQSGNFELNVMLPVAYYNAQQSITLLAAATENMYEKCIKDIVATEAGPEMVERGLAVVTALAPIIGYDRSAAIAKEASATGKTIREICTEQQVLPPDELAKVLDPFQMTEPNL